MAPATITVVGGRRCGHRVSIWSSTGACWAGCTCSARCWRGAGCGSCASPTTSARTRRWRCSRSASTPWAGCPGVVLADRMGCLKGGVVANKVVPTAEYVRFAAHHGFRPDFCEAADPESKGIVENLVGYAKTDLMIPGPDGSGGEPFTDLVAANAAAAAWCVEVNAAVHCGDLRGAGRAAGHRAGAAGRRCRRCGPASAGSVTRKVDRLSCVRFGSARYSVPVALIGAQVRLRVDHDRSLAILTVRAAGAVTVSWSPSTCWSRRARRRSTMITTAVRGRRRGGRCARKPRQEKAFCALGPTAEAFITGAAAAGNTRLGPELVELNTLAAAHGERAFLDALARAVAFGRWRAADVRSILAAGTGTPSPPRPGTPSCSSCPGSRPARCPTTPSAARPWAPPDRRRRRHRGREVVVSAAAPALAPDLADGLRRLKLAAMRQLAPELLRTAKTQRWAPEELLRTLVEAEITARDASNARTRLKTAAFPVVKTLDEFDRAVSSINPATLDYLARLEWITARENLCLVGPAGHRQEPPARRPRRRRRASRAPGPLLHRRRAGRDPLPRPGRQQRRPGHRHPAPQRPDHLRRGRVRPPRRHRRPTAVPVHRRRLRTPRPGHRLATGPSKPGAGSCPNTPPRSACSTGSCTTPTSWSPTASPTACAKPEPDKPEAPQAQLINPRGGDFYLATSGDRNLAVDNRRPSVGTEAAARLIRLTPSRRTVRSADHKSRRKLVQLAGLCPVRSSRARRGAGLARPEVSARAAIGRSVAIIGSASRGRSAPPRS